MRSLTVVLTSVLLAASAPTSPNIKATCLNDPFGKANAFVSPDNKYALWGSYQNSELELEDAGTHADRPVGGFTVQTISLAWSPDSQHFVVNDRPLSSESDAYLFDTDTLQRTKLREKLTVAMPEVRRFYIKGEDDCAQCGVVSHGRDVMHSFLDVLRWTDDQHVELQLHGNFAGKFRHDNPDSHLYSAGCFDLRFRMALDGSVQKLSERITEPLSDRSACGWGPDD
jgi:hypothetical protein